MKFSGKTVLRLCIAGMGGYARAHHEIVAGLEQTERLRLLATCDPRYGQLRNVAEDFSFSGRSVDVLDDFDEMLDRHGDRTHFVSIATPIHLHAPMHARVVSRGLGCYLEKPPTLDPGELETMIERDAGAPFRTEVGFNYIAESWRHDLKRRILDGEWGELRALSFFGAWSRDHGYYQRTPWAGKLLVDGRLTLDSAFGNAAAHHVHNLLFFAGGKDVFSWAEPREVRSELYRAYPIEGADTVFSSLTTTDGLPLRLTVSHACQSRWDLLEVLHCERAEIRIYPYRKLEIIHRCGRCELVKVPTDIVLLREHLLHYLRYLRGETDRPLNRLADCRSTVAWNALNYLAARRIGTIPVEFSRQRVTPGKPFPSLVVPGLETVMNRFVCTGAFPSQQGVVWSQKGGRALMADLPNLRFAVQKIVGEVDLTRPEPQTLCRAR